LKNRNIFGCLTNGLLGAGFVTTLSKTSPFEKCDHTSENQRHKQIELRSEVRGFRVRGRYATEVAYMAKSSKQDRAEGLLYKVGGRVLRAIGSLTGDEKKKVKGRLGRDKGTVKGREGRLKDLFK
jgi:uncharacterized protein YjbJ (UPF0337 family)